jgi:hypothetical protein
MMNMLDETIEEDDRGEQRFPLACGRAPESGRPAVRLASGDRPHGANRKEQVMKSISTESFLEAIAMLLEEVHVGPPDPRATWITSNRPSSGFLGTLDTLPAGVASQAPAPGLNTIAAHAAHLRYALSLALRAMHGENPYAAAKWEESWRIQTVDEAAWTKLRSDLRSVHGELAAAIRSGPPLQDPDVFKGVIALVGHGAYHLGAVQAINRVLTKLG